MKKAKAKRRTPDELMTTNRTRVARKWPLLPKREQRHLRDKKGSDIGPQGSLYTPRDIRAMQAITETTRTR